MTPSDPRPARPAPAPEAAAAIRVATQIIRGAHPEPREERFGTIFREADPGGFRMM